MFLHPITVTVKRAGGRDREGDPLPGTEHTIDGCAQYPQTSSEAATTGTTVITGRVLLAPYGADIRSEDRVILPDGSEWAVDGDPGPWSSPLTGWQPGTQVALERVKGV
ncbi:hypothetical protein ABZ799_01330 [Nocardiopsis dassonvillei]|uniref:hypothetical protein n=1 Tax=Nocardiopsis dassonvillei TaxID=2014 RepID=UPI003408FC56